jgi:hypothetical protein
VPYWGVGHRLADLCARPLHIAEWIRGRGKGKSASYRLTVRDFERVLPVRSSLQCYSHATRSAVSTGWALVMALGTLAVSPAS